MQKDDLVYVGHMLDASRLIFQKVAGKTRAEFDADDNLQLALTHLIQILGEAARHVSPAFRQGHSEVPWRQIVGMRHKVVHDYIHIDFQTVWEVATVDLPPLLAELEKIMPPDPSGTHG